MFFTRQASEWWVSLGVEIGAWFGVKFYMFMTLHTRITHDLTAFVLSSSGTLETRRAIARDWLWKEPPGPEAGRCGLRAFGNWVGGRPGGPLVFWVACLQSASSVRENKIACRLNHTFSFKINPITPLFAAGTTLSAHLQLSVPRNLTHLQPHASRPPWCVGFCGG